VRRQRGNSAAQPVARLHRAALARVIARLLRNGHGLITGDFDLNGRLNVVRPVALALKAA